MSESNLAIGKRLKEMLRKGFSGANIFRAFAFLFFTWLIMECFFEIIEMQYHYYANTMTTVEMITGKKIDRYDGSELKEQSTEERLVRAMHKKTRFRLRDMRQGYRQIFP